MSVVHLISGKHASCGCDFCYTCVNWWYPLPSFFLYLRNHLCGYIFWCTFVKWWYLQVFFFLSPKFWFCGVLEELKSKKWFKMTKSYVCCAPQPSFFLYLRNHLCGYNFWCTFVKWWYLQVFFFPFSKILIL